MDNNLPVYECLLTANEQESTLILTRATEDFCYLMHLSPNCFGSILEKVTLKQISECIYQAFSYLKDGKNDIRVLREINGAFWICTLSYDKPVLTMSMCPVCDVVEFEQTYHTNNLINMPLNRFLGCFYDSILINYSENHYRIASISDGLSQLTGLRADDPIDNIFSSMHCICTDNLFRRCLEQNRVIYFLDNYTNNSKCYYLLIALMPLNHSQRNLMAAIHLLEEKDYYNMMKSVKSEPEKVGDSGYIGVAVFQTDGGKYKNLINTNRYFDHLVYSQEDFAFLQTKVIPLCCAQQNITTFSHRIGNLDCFVTAIPTLATNQLFLFIIPDSGMKQSMQSLADRLTKREFEIACHLFNGNSIRGIAIDCGITEGTVKKTLSNIYNKLQISNRVELVRLIFSCNG